MSEQEQSDSKYMRRIRSFVKREGRLTKGQASALERLMPTWGITAPEQGSKLNIAEILLAGIISFF